MGSYRLTKAADKDFDSIFDFGIDKFGLQQAQDYQRGIVERFGQLADRPLRYPLWGMSGTVCAVASINPTRSTTGWTPMKS